MTAYGCLPVFVTVGVALVAFIAGVFVCTLGAASKDNS